MTMINDIYIIEVDKKPIFASSLFVEFENKKKELSEVPFTITFTSLNKQDHSALLKECTKNIIDLHRKNNAMEMVNKND